MKCKACGFVLDESLGHCPACGINRRSSEPVVRTVSGRPARKPASAPTQQRSSSQPRYKPGTLLGDRYRVLRRVGRGGMGEVWLAEDLRLDERVALKFLPLAVEKDEGRLSWLVNEVKIARTVSHPNVCRVHDLGTADGTHFLSMEFLEGKNLRKLLREEAPLPLSAAEIGRQLALGLSAVHERGVLHRDLTPSNVMLDLTGSVRLTDFGVAGPVGSRSAGGTPAYMAPEQHAGEEASVASDLYALGLILYELATGRRAFKAATALEWSQLHQRAMPRPPSSLADQITPTFERIVMRCLQKDPRDRPASAREIAEVLTQISKPRLGEGRGDPSTGLELRRWPPLEPPQRPYPVLLPYRHPELLAGRDLELARLLRCLRSPVSAIGLCAPSGVGKSSLLAGGFVPQLRSEGQPVALERHPQEPGLVARLLGDLLVDKASPKKLALELADDDFAGFIDRLVDTCRLSGGRTPVLVLDQFEDLFRRPEAREARAKVGALLASTAGSTRGGGAPVCRWLLAYRQDYHGHVQAWLRDVLIDARDTFTGLDGLPFDFSGPDRFLSLTLSPLATPSASAADPVAEAELIFREVIERPLALAYADGSSRFDCRFAPGGIDRLARAFAEARIASPDAPLTPELQVVLAHLLASATLRDDQGAAIIEVPENVDQLIGEALEAHLKRALESSFPAGRAKSLQGRARALLALRELASSSGRREEGLSSDSLEQAMALPGIDGKRILQRLADPLTRLVVPIQSVDGRRYALSHDRLAQAVVRLTDRESEGDGLEVDAELLGLRRFVALQTALSRGGSEAASRLSSRHYRTIRRHIDALLWDQQRRDWWESCRRRRRSDLASMSLRGAAILLVVTMIGLTVGNWASKRAEREALLDRIVLSEPEPALAALVEAKATFEGQSEDLRDHLEQREEPFDVVAFGLGGIHPSAREQAVIDVVELLMPYVEESPLDLHRVALLIWALDYATPKTIEKGPAHRLRERLLAPIQAHNAPPPRPDRDDSGWVVVPAGTFLMGAWRGENEEEIEPPVEVSIGSLLALDHEVTNEEFRRFEPEHKGDDHLPAAYVSWYQAYAYAAWLGGRLPTEAEWEYMARAGCQHTFCGPDGEELTLLEVASARGNSLDPVSFEPVPQPVKRLAANPWGLHDMLGNLWEYTADWNGPYPGAAPRNIKGPTHGAGAEVRGGSYSTTVVHHATRARIGPGEDAPHLGFRPVLPLETK